MPAREVGTYPILDLTIREVYEIRFQVAARIEKIAEDIELNGIAAIYEEELETLKRIREKLETN
jgi:hypothetical protein